VDIARRQEVQVYTIGLGKTLKVRDSVGEKVLKGFARSTGGEYFLAPSPAELGQIFKRIIVEVANQSKLTFVPPSRGNDGAVHQLSVRILAHADLSLLYKPTTSRNIVRFANCHACSDDTINFIALGLHDKAYRD